MAKNRYSRQEALPQIGSQGQEKIKKSRILCIGAGGLGSPALLYLAAAGAGKIGIVDSDQVDESNLQRQILFRTNDQGKLKSDMARDRLLELNPNIEVISYVEHLTSKNAIALFENYDIIIDGTDNFAAKFLINDAAVKLGKPVIFGSISQFEGQIAVFWAERGPCYRCLYSSPPKSYIPNCAEAGVIGGIAGIIGSIQALEALKILVGNLETLIGRLAILDTLSMNFNTFSIPKDKSCPVCSIPKNEIKLHEIPHFCIGEHELTSEALLNNFSANEYQLVDVREKEEWDTSHIAGAIHFPLSAIQAGAVPQTLTHSSSKIVLYCQAGVRSKKALEILSAKLDPIRLFHLRGGIEQWTGKKFKA